ncbi:unnamed protein product, partial [Sphacelaria rigidula]
RQSRLSCLRLPSGLARSNLQFLCYFIRDPLLVEREGARKNARRQAWCGSRARQQKVSVEEHAWKPDTTLT